MPNEATTAVAGLAASFLSGLLGIGGGLVLTPLLLYLPPIAGGAAIPVKIITGLTIVQAIAGSALGTLRHRAYGNVSARLVWLMGPPIAVTSLIGALVSREMPDSVILLIFAIVSFVGAVMLVLPTSPQTTDGGRELAPSRPVAFAISGVLGIIGGIIGIGGIAFIIAALIYVLRVPARVAIGSSLGIGLFSAVAGLIGKAATAQIDPPLALIVFAAAVVASPVGSAVSVRTPSRALVGILAVLVALTAIRVAITAVTGA